MDYQIKKKVERFYNISMDMNMSQKYNAESHTNVLACTLRIVVPAEVDNLFEDIKELIKSQRVDIEQSIVDIYGGYSQDD